MATTIDTGNTTRTAIRLIKEKEKKKGKNWFARFFS
jgi:hypothetical protein